MKMKLEEMLTGIDFDVDVCDDYADDLYVAFCPPTALTEYGKQTFSDILDLDVEVNEKYSTACVLLDDKPNCEHLHEMLKQFVWAVAGYVSDEKWKKWFYYPDEDEILGVEAE